MLEVHSLASGSKGNCTIIKNDNTTIVIDCGCTKTYLKTKFKEVNVEINDVDALFITHTHSDHVSAISLFKDIKTYAGTKVLDNTHIINNKETITINDISIYPIALSHDCLNTYGFIIYYKNEKIVYITDTGYIKEEYIEKIKNPDYLILEFNHDIEMLMNTNRPHFLKQRILGDSGHLCNEDASNICKEIIGDNTKLIWLAHLSEQANTPEIALNSLQSSIQHADIWIKCLSQNEVTSWKKE